jgi:hypothetical protein
MYLLRFLCAAPFESAFLFESVPEGDRASAAPLLAGELEAIFRTFPASETSLGPDIPYGMSDFRSLSLNINWLCGEEGRI